MHYIVFPILTFSIQFIYCTAKRMIHVHSLIHWIMTNVKIAEIMWDMHKSGNGKNRTKTSGGNLIVLCEIT